MVTLKFLGTKGEIEEFNENHKYNASLLMVKDKSRLMIDYGRLRKFSLDELAPDALLITHAHPDTYAWLNEDVKTNVPVYLTSETYNYGKFRPPNSKVYEPGTSFQIGDFGWSAYRVLHSIRCPAVGFRVKVANKIIVYNSDVVDILDKDGVLEGVDYYIGDGSAIRANLVRRRGDQLFGHARIGTQINWCRKSGIKNIIFTHLGKETIEKEESFKAEHPDVILAYDGMELEV